MTSAYSRIEQEAGFNKPQQGEYFESSKEVCAYRISFGLIFVGIAFLVSYQVYWIQKFNQEHQVALGPVKNIWLQNTIDEALVCQTHVSKTYSQKTFPDIFLLTHKHNEFGTNTGCVDGNEKPSNGGCQPKTSSWNSASTPQQQTFAAGANAGSTRGSGNFGGGSDGNGPPHNKNTCMAQCMNSEIPDPGRPVNQEQNRHDAGSSESCQCTVDVQGGFENSHPYLGNATDDKNASILEPSSTDRQRITGEHSRPAEEGDRRISFNNNNFSSNILLSGMTNLTSQQSTVTVEQINFSTETFRTEHLPADILTLPTENSANLGSNLVRTRSPHEGERYQTSRFSMTDRHQENTSQDEHASIYAENLENVSQSPQPSNYGDLERSLLSFHIRSGTTNQREHLPVGNTPNRTGNPQNVHEIDTSLLSESETLQSIQSLNQTSASFGQSRFGHVNGQLQPITQHTEISNDIEEDPEIQVLIVIESSNLLDEELDMGNLHPSDSENLSMLSNYESQVSIEPANVLDEQLDMGYLHPSDPGNSSMVSNESQEIGNVYCYEDIRHGTAVYVDERTDVARQGENCAIPIPSGTEETQPVGASDFIFPMRREPRNLRRLPRFRIPPTNLTAEQYPHLHHQPPELNQLFSHPSGCYAERECRHCMRLFPHYTETVCGVCGSAWCGSCSNPHTEDIDIRPSSDFEQRATGGG